MFYNITAPTSRVVGIYKEIYVLKHDEQYLCALCIHIRKRAWKYTIYDIRRAVYFKSSLDGLKDIKRKTWQNHRYIITFVTTIAWVCMRSVCIWNVRVKFVHVQYLLNYYDIWRYNIVVYQLDKHLSPTCINIIIILWYYNVPFHVFPPPKKIICLNIPFSAK